jgi:6-phospho-beta-glucosidase
VKVALVGGGGFRTPLVEEALATIAPHAVDELVLHDLDERRLALIAAALRARREERGSGAPVRTTTSLIDAVEGAGAVLVAVRPGGLAARVVDEAVPLELGVLGQETVGPGGVAFALRTVPEIVRIAETVRERSPGAWLVNLTNPAGLVTEAARGVLGERAIGICDSPAALWRHVTAAVPEAGALRPAYVGLNHLGWLTGAHDGDRDALPALVGDPRIAPVHEVRLAGIDAVRTSGTIPNEYLVYFADAAAVAAAFRRDGTRGAILEEQQAAFYDAAPSSPARALAAWRAAKDARHRTYLAEAGVAGSSGASEDEPSAALTPDELGYGAVAAEVLGALDDRGQALAILGVRNGGAIDWLDGDATVEVPCVAGPDGVAIDRPGDVTGEARGLVERVREAERLTLAAAAAPSRGRVIEAVAAHPVVPTRDLAERIVDGYRARHPWLRDLAA